jgi:hypothetical protein
LLPNEIVVVNADNGVAKLEVDRSGRVDYIAVYQVVARASLEMGRREGLKDLREDGAGERADGVAAVEEHWLAVGLIEDFEVRSILLGNAYTIHIDPVTSITIGRLGGGDDRSLC